LNRYIYWWEMNEANGKGIFKLLNIARNTHKRVGVDVHFDIIKDQEQIIFSLMLDDKMFTFDSYKDLTNYIMSLNMITTVERLLERDGI